MQNLHNQIIGTQETVTLYAAKVVKVSSRQTMIGEETARQIILKGDNVWNDKLLAGVSKIVAGLEADDYRVRVVADCDWT